MPSKFLIKSYRYDKENMVQFGKTRGTILATSGRGFKKDVSALEIVAQKVSKKYRILLTDQR